MAELGKPSPPQRGTFCSGSGGGRKGGWMLSVSEGRQINTTKHFGGGVNVSAGATLLIKAGALSQNSYTPHRLGTDRDNIQPHALTGMRASAHTYTYTHTHTHTHTRAHCDAHRKQATS